jgi:hypothetical protein
MTSQPSERAIVAGKIDPQSANNTTKNTDSVDMSKFHEALFIVQVGATDSTVDLKLEESSNGSSGWQDISGKAITQLSALNNKIAMINLKSAQLDAGYRYVRGLLTLGNGSAQLVAAIALGVAPRFAPASDDKLGAVVQIVT